MRVGRHDAEWDGIWAEYDQHFPQPPAAPEPCAPEPARNRKARPWRLLALLLLVLSMPTALHTEDAPRREVKREALLSVSPIEAGLPPLSVSIARLANESAAAACWALELRPQGGGCGEGGAAR